MWVLIGTVRESVSKCMNVCQYYNDDRSADDYYAVADSVAVRVEEKGKGL